MPRKTPSRSDLLWALLVLAVAQEAARTWVATWGALTATGPAGLMVLTGAAAAWLAARWWRRRGRD